MAKLRFKGDLTDHDQALLDELDGVLASNPLEGYNNSAVGKVHEKQIRFHKARTRTKCLLGGNRSGKSSAGAVDDLIQALPEQFVPKHLQQYKYHEGPFKCRVITPDLGHTMNAVLESLQQWIPPAALKGGSWKEAYRADKRILSLVGGSQFDFMSYETDLDKFGGVARHRIRYDEEPPGEKGREIRKRGLQRLRDYQGDEVFTLTPEFGLSWLYDDIWEHRGPEVSDRTWENDDLFICRAATFDNPFVPADEKADAEFTEEEYRVKVLGEFFHIKGLVYDDFKPDHVVKTPEIKHVRDLEVVVGIDPGYRTTAVVFVGFDKDNIGLVFDELYLHKDEALPPNTALQIKIICKKWRIDPDWFYIDPMASNASLTAGRDNIEAMYQREGIPAIKANNKVEAGILEVKRRFQSVPKGLLVAENCTKTRWELERYRVDDTEEGKFKVVKSNDHAADALRYVCMSRLWYAPQPPPERPKTFDINWEAPWTPGPPAPSQAPLGPWN